MMPPCRVPCTHSCYGIPSCEGGAGIRRPGGTAGFRVADPTGWATMINNYYSRPSVSVRGVACGTVMGLLGFSFLFTTAGAALGTVLGPGAFIPALVLSLGAL